jgi:DNA-directed RNA polymerase specialized sigma54-like protein
MPIQLAFATHLRLNPQLVLSNQLLQVAGPELEEMVRNELACNLSTTIRNAHHVASIKNLTLAPHYQQL